MVARARSSEPSPGTLWAEACDISDNVALPSQRLESEQTISISNCWMGRVLLPSPDDDSGDVVLTLWASVSLTTAAAVLNAESPFLVKPTLRLRTSRDNSVRRALGHGDGPYPQRPFVSQNMCSSGIASADGPVVTNISMNTV